MTLFDYFRKDWKEEWVENAIHGKIEGYKLDNANNSDLKTIASMLRQRKRECLAEDIELLAKVKKVYNW